MDEELVGVGGHGVQETVKLDVALSVESSKEVAFSHPTLGQKALTDGKVLVVVVVDGGSGTVSYRLVDEGKFILGQGQGRTH